MSRPWPVGVPGRWKQGNIVPLHKKSPQKDSGDYSQQVVDLWNEMPKDVIKKSSNQAQKGT